MAKGRYRYRSLTMLPPVLPVRMGGTKHSSMMLVSTFPLRAPSIGCSTPNNYNWPEWLNYSQGKIEFFRGCERYVGSHDENNIVARGPQDGWASVSYYYRSRVVWRLSRRQERAIFIAVQKCAKVQFSRADHRPCQDKVALPNVTKFYTTSSGNLLIAHKHFKIWTLTFTSHDPKNIHSK